MANFSAKYSIMTQEMVDSFCESFYIPAEVHPTAPGRDKTIAQFPAGKVGVYTRIFDVCGYRIPFTKFFMAVLKYFRVHISQLSPFGAARVSHFEVLRVSISLYSNSQMANFSAKYSIMTQEMVDSFCENFYIPAEVHPTAPGRDKTIAQFPAVTVFRAFYTRTFSDGLFSFAKRSTSAPSCFPKPPDSIKNWADHFFWVDSCVFPISVPLYTGGVLEKDPTPHLTARQEQTVRLLESHKAPFRRYLECFLCLVGLSPYYPFDDNSYPDFERPDRTGGCCKLLEKKDSEILRLKSQLAEKEAKTVEITITRKDHDISLLDSRATHLESALNDAQVACTEAGTKITSLASERDRLASEVSSLRAGFKDFKEKMEIQQEKQAQELYNRVAELEAHVMDASGRLEGEFYPTYLTLLAGRRWLLTHGIQLALLKCLKSSEYQGILGHALGRAVDFGMQEGLEAGHEHGVAGRSLSVVDAYNPEVASADYVNAVKALEDAHFPLVDLLKSKKDARMDEVLDCFLLDGPLAELPEAASLQPCIEQLSIPIHHAGDKTAIEETSLSFALMNVHARAEGAKKHAAALRQLMMEIVSAPLSSQTWVGEASISAAPLSIEDYAEEDTDEALGSVVAVPHLERCCL
ncbi:hypothetical protein Tco_0726506 [Tanacetum coccineum]|uniref:Transposase (Putative), gypsy type n=1 Tax=Tanacetum coccineum TaxID=301880 RepID=A0ABQ4YGP4_9ASTR